MFVESRIIVDNGNATAVSAVTCFSTIAATSTITTGAVSIQTSSPTFSSSASVTPIAASTTRHINRQGATEKTDFHALNIDTHTVVTVTARVSV